MIETTDLHWAAGFLDGEGCFSLCAKQPVVMAYQKDPFLLLKLQNIFGCGTISESKHHGTICECRVYSRRAAAIMMTLYSLMSPRRQKRIAEILTVFKTSHKNKRPDIQRARGYHGRFKPIQAELFHA